MVESLRSRTIHGMFWTLIEAFGARFIQFGVGIVLARILLPAEFGLIGMLTLFMALAQVFLDSGFGSALIQKKDATEKDICSIFYFNIFIGIVVAGILCLTAPFISNFYEQPALTPLTRLLSLTIVINSLGLIQNTILRKNIDFKVITLSTLYSVIISGVIGIYLAYKGWGVWSLAIQQIVAASIRTATLWFINTWRPKLIFSLHSLRGLFGFGSRILASGLLNQLFSNIYLLVIGKLFSASDLGYYTRAKQFQQLPVQTLSGMISKVTFPVFSTIKDDTVRLKRGLKKALTTLVLINFPVMVGIAVIARPLVLALLTEKWLPCVPYLQLLCCVGLMYPLHLINLNVLQALGRSDLFLWLEVLKKALTCINIAITWRWGILALIGGQVFLSFVSYYLNSYYNGVLLEYSFTEQLRDLSGYLLTSLFMGICVFALSLIPFPNIMLQLICQIILGVMVYISICGIFRLSAFIEMYQLAFERITNH